MAAEIVAGLGLGIALAAGALATVTYLGARRAERLAPPIGQFREVAGARLHYTDTGSGPALVLIHGLGGNLRNFAPALIAQLAATHRVIAVDRPGAGHSTVSGPHPDIITQVTMIAELIEQLGVAPAVLVGHSLGGAMALALAQTRPELVASLALVAPFTQPQDEVPQAFRIMTIRSAFARQLVAWLLVGPLGRLTGSVRRSPVFAPEPVPADFAGAGGGALVFRPRAFDATSRDLQSASEEIRAIQAGYGALACPVAVLFGVDDEILAPKLHGEALARQVPGTRLTQVAGGHMLPYTQPDRTARWLAEAIATSANA